jgi:hypothetical protein
VQVVREKIASVGIFLALAGIISSVLQLIGYELRILRALDQQPPAIAWGVRLGLVVVGGVLFLAGPKQSADAAGPPAPTREQLAADPRVQWLLAWAYQNLGAALSAQPGAPRIAHITFWNHQSLPASHDDPAVAKSILYVDGYQGQRWVVIGDIATRTAQLHPCQPDAWAYNVPGG